jgi:hypothetical protein
VSNADAASESADGQDPDDGAPDTDALKTDVEIDPSVPTSVDTSNRKSVEVSGTPAQKIEQSNAELAKEQAKQTKQNTIWRRFLFWGVFSLVIAVAVLSAGLIWWYMVASDGKPNPVVLSTWFSASVVQVVGLLLVITRHLFPENKS